MMSPKFRRADCSNCELRFRHQSAPDHMRQFPFIHQLCSHPLVKSISIYIKLFQIYFFHVVLILSPETFYICYLHMRYCKTTYFKVQHHFEVILSSMWFVLVRNIYTTIKTLHRCITICRWRSQRANFVSLRRETV